METTTAREVAEQGLPKNAWTYFDRGRTPFVVTDAKRFPEEGSRAVKLSVYWSVGAIRRSREFVVADITRLRVARR